MEKIFSPIRRAQDEWREVQTEFAPHEVHGLSDDLSRMIPAEAATLGHPVLKYLWHARRIEHALLTYRVQGVMSERVSSESDVMTEVERPKPPPKSERGPIIICLDTSGSMHGEPEIVAKASVLEALRVAHAEKRACYLYSFSGPGDVAEHELKLTEEGLAGFLNFLACSFPGGTDVAEPVRRAVKRLQEAAWQRADILLVGDGELRPQIEAMIAAAGMGGAVRLLGWQDESGVRAAMTAAHALVTPSFAEGLPVVIMEAMACARPIIATYIAGIPELVRPGHEGWLVPAGDAGALAETMLVAAASDRETLCRLGASARARVIQRHDIRDSARQLAALFSRSTD